MRTTIIAAALATAATLAAAAPAEAQRYPDVRDNRRGETVVQMTSRCEMVYDRRGQRVHTARACDRRDIEEANWIVRRYREDQARNSAYGDRRYDRYDRNDRRYRSSDYDRYDDRRYTRRIAPASVVGKRMHDAYDMLASGGYRMMSEHPWRDGKVETVWFNRSANSCVSVYSRKGKIRAVTPAARQRCGGRY